VDSRITLFLAHRSHDISVPDNFTLFNFTLFFYQEVMQHSSLLECRRSACGISHLLGYIVPVIVMPCLNSSAASATDVTKLWTITHLQEPKQGSIRSITTRFPWLISLLSSVMPVYIADSKPSVAVSAHTHTLKPYNPSNSLCIIVFAFSFIAE